MLLFALLALSNLAHADVVELDCNVEGGDQQVRVLDGAHGLRLEELTMAGSWKTRALSAQEWGEKKIKLSGSYGETYTLVYDAKVRTWFYSNKGPGMSISGAADCAE